MKRYVQIAAICLITVLLVQGCKCNKSQNKPLNTQDSLALNAEDSVQMVHEFFVEDSENIFKISSQQWITNTLKNDKANWENFNFKSMGEMETKSTPFTPSENFYKNFESVLRWSSDSNFIIDFGSYGSIVVKDNNGNTHLEGGDPDTKVSLINVAKRQQSQILFAGPSTKVMDVKWLSQTEAVMLFSEDGEKNRTDTLLWLIDVPRNLIRQYQYH